MSSPEKYTIGWICAINAEYVAAQAFLDERHDAPEYVASHDSNHYTLGKVWKHNVVIAVLPDGEYGISCAAGVAKDMLHSFPNVRIGLMVGIGGGAPSAKHDIRLGDVVVCAARDGQGGVFQYDFGKAIQGQGFHETAILNQPPVVLRTAVTGLRAQYEGDGNRLADSIDAALEKKPRLRNRYKRPPTTDTLYRSGVIHPPNNESSCELLCGVDPSSIVERCERTASEDNPTVHYGRIASANTLMKDAFTRDTLAATRGVLCFEMEAAGLMNHFPCLVIRGICDYSDTHKNKEWQGYAAMSAAAYAKDLLYQIPSNRIEDHEKISELLSRVSESVEHVRSGTTELTNVIKHVRTVLLDVDQKTVLARLEDEVAVGASFDSRAEEHNPRCLKNTRVDLLLELSEWAANPDTEAIFWLNGMAGTGKSTISRTISERLSSTGGLGASFFFKRGEADRGTMSKFVPTITADLTRKLPAIARPVKDALDNDPAILRKTVREQFHKLLSDPLSMTAPSSSSRSPITIVIDALDECEQDEDIKLIIHLFSRARTVQSGWLKIFITSRPELPIRLGFNAVQGQYQDLILHELPQTVVEHDISIFLKEELTTIRNDYNALVPEYRQLSEDWPGSSRIENLVQMAIPLFIFAATVCRFIADRKLGIPEKQLQKIIHPQSRGKLSQMAAMYLPVLENLIAGKSPDQREEILQDFRLVVGSIIILASPLSISALARILNFPEDEVAGRLEMLHSVLSIPSVAQAPVTLLHLSFRDFLLDQRQCGGSEFCVDEQKRHQALGVHCLRVMECLRRDICDISVPGTPRSVIDPHKIKTCLPPEVQYACLYWVYHIQSAGVQPGDCEKVHGFMKHHFLHWIESLSLLGRARESVRLVKSLQLLYMNEGDEQLSEFLDDALRFILANISAIDSTPLQIYSSLLVFSPQRSKVRTTFAGEIPRWVCLQPKVNAYWGQCMQTIEGHTDGLLSVAISHDSALVASGSKDTTIRIWAATTGECVHVLRGHQNWVTSVGFSHSSALVASGSTDMTIRIWRQVTGECVRLIQNNGEIHSVALSHNSAFVASSPSARSIRIWCLDTGKCVRTLETARDTPAPSTEVLWTIDIVSHTGPTLLDARGIVAPTVRAYDNMGIEIVPTRRRRGARDGRATSAVFSHDCAFVASGHYDHTARVWLAATGGQVRTFEGHDKAVVSVAFSHESKLLASGSSDTTIRVWRLTTGQCVKILRGHSEAVMSVAFSHESKLLASGSNDTTIRVWRLATGQCVHVLEGHDGRVRSVVFSKNSELVASGSSDTSIRIWHTITGECKQVLRGPNGLVSSVIFSHDSLLIASGSAEGFIRVWSLKTGECVQSITGHSYWVMSVAFSHDSALLASGATDCTMRIWSRATGECLQILPHHNHKVLAVAFSLYSVLVAWASIDSTMQIWKTTPAAGDGALESHIMRPASVAISHDSTLVVASSTNMTVGIWRVDTGECMRALEGHTGEVNSVAFSHDSELVASGSSDMTIRLWRVATGACLRTFYGHTGEVTSVAFSKDSVLLASGSSDKTTRVWRVDYGECEETFEGHSDTVTSVGFSHDSGHIVTGSVDKTIRIWRVMMADLDIQTFQDFGDGVSSVVFSQDLSLVASCSADNRIRLWRVDTGECVQKLEGHSGLMRSVTFSPSSELLGSVSDDNTIRIWRAATAECLQTLKGHDGLVTSVTFSPSSELLVSVSNDNTIRIWRAATGQCLGTLDGHGQSVISVDFLDDRPLIAANSGTKTIHIWRDARGTWKQTSQRPQTLQRSQTSQSHNIISTAFSPDLALVAMGFNDTTVEIWRGVQGGCLRKLHGHVGDITSMAFSHKSAFLATGSSDRTIRIWRISTGECVLTLKGHSQRVMSVAFSHDSTLVVSASGDETIRIWQAATGECVRTLVGHGHWIFSVTFSHDSVLIASGSDDKTVRIWHTATGECVQTLRGHKDRIRSVVFSHDSALVASGSDDTTSRIWRVDTGDCVQNLSGHENWIMSTAFSHNSALLATGSVDQTIRIWDKNTGDCVRTLSGHDHCVLGVAFSHDSVLVVSGSGDETWRTWSAATGNCVQTLDVVPPHLSCRVLPHATGNCVQGPKVQPRLSYRGLWDISKDTSWVTCNEENLFWLPKEYRPSAWAVSGSTIAIGCSSGNVIIIGLLHPLHTEGPNREAA